MSIFLPDVEGCFEITDVNNKDQLDERFENLSKHEKESVDYFFTLEDSSLSSLIMTEGEGYVQRVTFKDLVHLCADNY